MLICRDTTCQHSLFTKQKSLKALEIFCQLDALLGSFHEGFQFRRDLDICLQYLIDRSFEFGGMGGLEE